MSFQKCPACNGAGWTGVGYPTGVECTVCRGQKIINTLTGTPPYKIVTTTGTTIDDIRQLDPKKGHAGD